MSYEVSAGDWAHPPIGGPAQPAFSATRGAQTAVAPDAAPTGLSPGTGDGGARGEDELSFWDFLDLVNPLQHIPVISTIYRELTGDEIAAPMRTLGGFLFTGPVGFVNGVVNGIVQEASGRDIGQNLFALFHDDAPDGGDASTAERVGPESAPTNQAAAAAAVVSPQPSRPPPRAPDRLAGVPDAVMPANGLEPQDGGAVPRNALSGDQALRAFLSDMGAAGAGPRGPAASSNEATPPVSTASAPPVTAVPTARFYPLPKTDSRPVAHVLTSQPVMPPPGPPPVGSELSALSPDAASAATTTAAASDEPSVAERMLLALEKYETMARRRRAAAGHGG